MTNIQNVTEALNSLKDLAEALPVAITIDVTLTQAGQAADAKVVGDALDAITYTYGTTDMIAGISALKTGKLYFVYE